MICPRCKGEHPDDGKPCPRCNKDREISSPGKAGKTSPRKQKHRMPPLSFESLSSKSPSKPSIDDQGFRYQMVKQLSTGKNSRLFLARDNRMDRITVIKEFSPGPGEDSEKFISRANARARQIWDLSHQSLPRIVDFFGLQDKFYLVMEYVDGVSVRELAGRRQNKQVTFKEAVCWAEQMLKLFKHLQSRQPPFFSGPFDPDNFILSSDGIIHFAGFNLGEPECIDEAHGGYSPPEATAGEWGPSSDIFNIGAILHTLLSGDDPSSRKPFHFPPITAYRQDIPSPFANMLDQMLAPAKSDRYADAVSALNDLAKISVHSSEKADFVFKKKEEDTPRDLPESESTMQSFWRIFQMALGIILLLVFLYMAYRAPRQLDQAIKDPASDPSTIEITPVDPKSEMDNHQLLSQARDYYEKNLNSKTLEYLNELILRDPGDTEAYLLRFEVYHKAMEYRKALEDLNHVISREPAVVAHYHRRLDLYKKLKMNHLILEDLEVIVRLDEKSLKEKNELGELLFELGLNDYEKGNLDSAYDRFVRVKKLNPSEDRPDEYMAKILARKGEQAYRQRDYDGAVKYLNSALKLDDSLSQAHLFMGLALKNKGNFSAGERHLLRVLQLNPEDPNASSALAGVYLDVGQDLYNKKKYQESITYLERVIRYEPENTRAQSLIIRIYSEMADTLQAQRKFEESIKILNRVLEIDPSYAYGYYKRGNAYFRTGMRSKARQDLRYSLSLQENPFFKHGALQLLERLGDD